MGRKSREKRQRKAVLETQAPSFLVRMGRTMESIGSSFVSLKPHLNLPSISLEGLKARGWTMINRIYGFDIARRPEVSQTLDFELLSPVQREALDKITMVVATGRSEEVDAPLKRAWEMGISTRYTKQATEEGFNKRSERIVGSSPERK